MNKAYSPQKSGAKTTTQKLLVSEKPMISNLPPNKPRQGNTEQSNFSSKPTANASDRYSYVDKFDSGLVNFAISRPKVSQFKSGYELNSRKEW